MTRIATPALALVLSLAACGKGDDGPSSAADVSYPATHEGLHDLIEDIADAEAAGKDKKAGTLALSVYPTEYKAWFNDTFGPEVGAKLIAEFEPNLDLFPSFGKMLAAQRDRGRTEIKVESFDKPQDPESTTYQSVALEAAKKPVTLYSVRLTEPGKSSGMHLYNFVHDGKNFRFVGQMKMIKNDGTESAELDAVASLRLKDAKTFLETGKLPGDPQ